MPTKASRARKMLRDGKAKVVKRTPFTIQLTVDTKEYTQPITLGVDAGSKTIGLSATTDDEELFSSEVILRNDIVDLISTRKQTRRTRRGRLRYRKPRFLNRVKTKPKGWLAPSIVHKIQTHLRVISDVHKLLPISKIIVEVASFDVQKIKNPDIAGSEYQQGEQLGFWNVREYVLFRDGHKCHGKTGCKNNILNVHHIESRKTGGNAPNNLITLCEDCHTDYHSGDLKLNLKRGQSFRSAAFMGIMRWAFYEELKLRYTNVSLTYGYITKSTRITNNLPKEHRIDAFCIANNVSATLSDTYYLQKKVRCHNRQIHKAKILKGGVKRRNQAPYEVLGFRLFDKVLYQNKEYFIFGRRVGGFFDIRDLFGNKVNKGSISCKKFTLIEKRKYMLVERSVAFTRE